MSLQTRQYYKEHKIQIRKNRAKFLRRHPGYEFSLSRRFSYLKSNAKIRGLRVHLTFKEYVSLVEGKSCEYCKGKLPHKGGGLDRLDNKNHYVKSNVCPCCKSCNFQKGLLEKAGFIFPRTVELMRELHP